MKIVVGLGNPGQKYRGTRHNIGFDVISELGRRHSTSLPKGRFNAETVEVRIAGQQCLLVSPLTFMNLSGKSIAAAIAFYKCDPAEDLLVICDDLNLDVGRLRMRAKGSAGGQNGLKDTISRLGGDGFARLRVGIGKPPPQWDTANYVLGKYTDEEKDTMALATTRAADAVETWVGEGVLKAMNQFNGDPAKPANQPLEPPTGSSKKDSPAKPA